MKTEAELKQLSTNMFIDSLGKILFPRLSPSQRRHEAKNILIAIVFGVLLAGLIVGIISMIGMQRR